MKEKITKRTKYTKGKDKLENHKKKFVKMYMGDFLWYCMFSKFSLWRKPQSSCWFQWNKTWLLWNLRYTSKSTRKMQKPYNIFLNNKEQQFNNDFAGMQQSFLLSFQKISQEMSIQLVITTINVTRKFYPLWKETRKTHKILLDKNLVRFLFSNNKFHYFSTFFLLFLFHNQILCQILAIS